MTFIETPRLILRDWCENDIETFCRLNADSRVMEYFLKRLSPDESAEMYRWITGEISACGYGLYAVECKADGAFIGYTGFHNFDLGAGFPHGVEIGWRIACDRWGQGYATEAAAACLAYAKGSLPFKEVLSFTSLPNTRSQRVMQKAGMEKAGYFPHPKVPDGHPLKEHVLYLIRL